MKSLDVVIIGGGVAGPALAAALAPHEMRVALLERDAGPLDTARGDHLQPRAVEILDMWGALGDLLGRGAEQRLGTVWYDAQGEPLLRAMVDGLDVPHPYFLYLNHELISQALLGAAARNPNFELHKPIAGWSLIEQSPTSSAIEVMVDENQALTIDAAVLVGADGQNSAVRRMAGIDTDVVRYSRPITIFFAPYADQPEGNSLSAHIGDGGIVALVPRTGGGCKIGIATAPDELSTWRHLEPEAVRVKLNAMAQKLPIGTPTHVGVYPPVRVTARQWVRDNIVLIGDACHAMHPAQSQGMNVSIRCADALARALAGSGGDVTRVLAHYEATTRPAIEPILEANHRAGSLFDSTDAGALRQFTETLRGLGSSPDATRGYALTTAGYPPPG